MLVWLDTVYPMSYPEPEGSADETTSTPGADAQASKGSAPTANRRPKARAPKPKAPRAPAARARRLPDTPS